MKNGRCLQIVRQPADLAGCHNLEVILHLLSPTRDACLMNKGADVLIGAKKECQNWWASRDQMGVPKCPCECKALSTGEDSINSSKKLSRR